MKIRLLAALLAVSLTSTLFTGCAQMLHDAADAIGTAADMLEIQNVIRDAQQNAVMQIEAATARTTQEEDVDLEELLSEWKDEAAAEADAATEAAAETAAEAFDAAAAEIDWEERNALGVEPIRPYINEVLSEVSMEVLLAKLAEAEGEPLLDEKADYMDVAADTEHGSAQRLGIEHDISVYILVRLGFTTEEAEQLFVGAYAYESLLSPSFVLSDAIDEMPNLQTYDSEGVVKSLLVVRHVLANAELLDEETFRKCLEIKTYYGGM